MPLKCLCNDGLEGSLLQSTEISPIRLVVILLLLLQLLHHHCCCLFSLDLHKIYAKFSRLSVSKEPSNLLKNCPFWATMIKILVLDNAGKKQIIMMTMTMTITMKMIMTITVHESWLRTGSNKHRESQSGQDVLGLVGVRNPKIQLIYCFGSRSSKSKHRSHSFGRQIEDF